MASDDIKDTTAEQDAPEPEVETTAIEPTEEDSKGATYVDAEVLDHKAHGRRVRRRRIPFKPVIIGVAVIAVILCGVMLKTHLELTSMHPVNVSVDAPGYEGTAIPMHVVGTDATGKQVDKLVGLQADGTGLELTRGSYDISIAASPISGEGDLYAFPDDTWHIDIDEHVKMGASVDFGDAISLTRLETVDTSWEVRDAAIAAMRQLNAKDVDPDGMASIVKYRFDISPNAFGDLQRYRGVLYAGATDSDQVVEGATALPVATSQFLIHRGKLYFVDAATGSATLHRYDLETGADEALVRAVDASQPVRFADGWAYCRAVAGGWSRVKLETGETQELQALSDATQCALLGFAGDKLVYVDLSAGVLESADIMYAELDGTNPQLVRKLEWNTAAAEEAAVAGDAIVVLRQGSPSSIAVYGLDGAQLWSGELASGYTATGAISYGGELFCKGTRDAMVLHVNVANGSYTYMGDASQEGRVVSLVGIDNGMLYYTAGTPAQLTSAQLWPAGE